MEVKGIFCSVKNESKSKRSSYTGEGQLYVLPKPTNLSFELPSISRESRSPVQPQEISRLNRKISDLERSKRDDQEKIRSLEEKLVDLESQLFSMQELNKSLVNRDMGNSDMPSIYHNIFITDLKEQVKSYSQEIEHYRMQNEVCKKELENVRKENQNLLAVIKRYRLMLATSIRNHSAKDEFTDHSFINGFGAESDGSSLNTVRNNSTFDKISKKETRGHILASHSSVLKGMMRNMMRIEDLEKLAITVEQLPAAKTLPKICTILAKEAKSLIKCEFSTVFIVSDRCKDIYSKGLHQDAFVGKAKVGNVWLDIHSEADCDSELPAFNKLEDLKYIYRQNDSIVIPIKIDNKPMLVLQCQGKEGKNKKRQMFTNIDEAILKMLAITTSLKLISIFAKDNEKIEKNHALDISGIAAQIVSSNNHRDIANKIHETLPKFFDFESAGIIFIDHLSGELFSMIHEPNASEYYGMNALKFPRETGLTGDTLIKNKLTLYNQPKRMSAYNPEIDNNAGATEVKQIVMIPLKDSYNNIVGILQLTNKSSGDVTKSDMQMLEKFEKLLGACVASANRTIEMTTLIVDAKEKINRVSGALNMTETHKADVETGVLFNQIDMIRSNMDEWIRIKKHKIMQNNLA